MMNMPTPKLYRIPKTDVEAAMKAAELGYRFICQRFTYSLNVPDWDIKRADSMDKSRVVDIALAELRHSRLYLDPAIPFEVAQSEYKKRTSELFDKGMTFIAVQHDKIVGYAIVIQNEIVSIAVDSAYQRRGIGTALVQECLMFCKNQSCSNLIIRTQDQNDKATAFYEKLGFRLIAVEADYHG